MTKLQIYNKDNFLLHAYMAQSAWSHSSILSLQGNP